MARPVSVRAWDPLVRLLHWSLAILLVVELLNEAGANPWHRYLGYAAAALVVARLAWGLVGPGSARLSAMLARAKQAMRRQPDGQSGHTPLGALMAFAFWGLTLFIALTGWMLGLEEFWGDDRLQDLHAGAAYLLGGCAVVHLGGALSASRAQGTNLIKAMITGHKSLPGRR